MPAQLKLLRDLIAERFPDATPVIHRATEPVASGISELDRILPGSGFPRGRVSVWAPDEANGTSGATSVMAATCRSVVSEGERAAWVSLAAPDTGSIVGIYWEQG